MKRNALLAVAVLSAIAGTVVGNSWPTPEVRASDHDDGENEVKARNLNLTDLYVFREDWQTGNAGDAGNLILIMNTNPRSLPRQQYFFSDRAAYDFHISRGCGQDPSVENDTPADDVLLRFTFGAPNASNVQTFTMTATVDSGTFTATGSTTPVTAAAPTINTLTLGSSTVTVFAGLREDPFFFDVEQFFRLRANLAGFGPAVTFPRTPGVDFTDGYNVNAIVARVPISFITGNSGADVFDVWETISLPAAVGVVD